MSAFSVLAGVTLMYAQTVQHALKTGVECSFIFILRRWRSVGGRCRRHHQDIIKSREKNAL